MSLYQINNTVSCYKRRHYVYSPCHFQRIPLGNAARMFGYETRWHVIVLGTGMAVRPAVVDVEAAWSFSAGELRELQINSSAAFCDDGPRRASR